MWKPGIERPPPEAAPESAPESPSRDEEEIFSPSSTVAATNNSKPGGHPSPVLHTKQLSKGTKNMRFMQRRAIKSSPAPKSTDMVSPLASPTNQNHTTTTNNNMDADSGDEEDLSRLQKASAADLYGEPLLGRRSFGGFRPLVEQMHQQQKGGSTLPSLAAKQLTPKQKRKRGRIS